MNAFQRVVLVQRPAILVVLGFVCGCGEGEKKFSMGQVKGKVQCNGMAVPSGLVTFSPIPTSGGGLPGKSASGEIQPDGTFVLSTYVVGDGAVLGQHNVSASGGDPDKPWPCELSKQIKFEVKSSGHKIVIELKADGSGTITES